MRIQHNIPAMNSYRNYSNNVSKVAKNLEKLSTGYKINRAGDDAAGLAISEKMRIQITGLEKAQDNAKAGINLVQTAEGALTEVHDMLNRMFDLAEQSANGTFDDSVDRNQLQKEINQLREEIDRIADGTNYNGIKLLDGSMESKSVTTGATDLYSEGALEITYDGQLGQTPQAGVFQFDFSNLQVNSDEEVDLAVNIFGIDLDPGIIPAGGDTSAESIASKIAEAWNNSEGASADALHGTTMRAEANGGKVTFTMSNPPTSAWAVAATATFENLDSVNNSQANQVSATTVKEAVDTTKGRQYAQATFNLTADMIADGRTLTIGKDTYVFALGRNSAYKDAANVIDLTDISETDLANSEDACLAKAAMRLTTAAKDNAYFKVGADTQKGTVTLTERDGAIDYSVYDLEGAANDPDDQDGNWRGLIQTGFYDTRNSTKGLTLQIGDTSESFNQMIVSVKDTHCEALGLSKIDISKQGNAQSAMDAIKAATNYVSDVRGGLGALQNRLDHTINNLSVAQENIQDAEANIRDVDVAKEMMAYTKNNILVQSAQAMLAQANQLPQGVLQLLG